MIGALVVRCIPARASRAAAPLLLAALMGCANVENLDGVADGLSSLLAGLAAPNTADDNGGQRADGVSDDPAGDDNGGQRPAGVSDDPPGNDKGGSDAGSDASDSRIQMRLVGDGLESGSAEYRVEAGRRKFKVEVEDFQPGTYTVALNGVIVAEIIIGPLGTAEIEFDSKTEVGHVPFPDGFPAVVRAGDVLNVGELVSGAF